MFRKMMQRTISVAMAMVMASSLLAVQPAGAETVVRTVSFGTTPDGETIPDGGTVFSHYRFATGMFFVNRVVNYHCETHHNHCTSATSGAAAAGLFNGEFERHPIEIRFDRLQDKVSLASRIIKSMSTFGTLKIDAYGVDGALVASKSAAIDRKEWTKVQLAAPGIAKIIVSASSIGNHVLIDEVKTEGDSEAPPTERDRRQPVWTIERPENNAGIQTHEFPVAARVVDDDRLMNAKMQIHEWDRRRGLAGDLIESHELCGGWTCSGPSASTPAEFKIRLPERRWYRLWFSATDVSGNRSHAFRYVEQQMTPAPEPGRPQLLALELNQGIQGLPNMVDADAGAQTYRSSVKLLPGKPMLFRQYWGAIDGPVPHGTGNLPVVVTMADGSTQRRNATRIPWEQPGPEDIPAVAANGSDWEARMRSQRPSLQSTANFVLSGNATKGAKRLTVGYPNSNDLFTVHLDKETTLGLNLIGLYDTANGIPAARYDQFESISMPYLRNILPYSNVDVLSYHRAHWSELPTQANRPHDPGCDIAVAMYLFGFGHERAVYLDEPNSWVVDVAAGWNSDRRLRGCHFRLRDIERYGSDVSTALFGDDVAHEIGHAHALGHATNLHEEGSWNNEDWPHPHGAMGPDGITDFGVAIKPGGGQGEWDVVLVDPCTNSPTAAQRLDQSTPCGDTNDRFRHELMSYGWRPADLNVYRTMGNAWLSAINYNRMYNAVVNGSIGSPLDRRFRAQAAADEAEIDAMLVSGRIFADGRVHLESAITKPVDPDALQLAELKDPDVVIEFVDGQGNVLASEGAIAGSSDQGEKEGAMFIVPLRAHPKTAQIRAVIDGKVIDTLDPQGDAPTISGITATRVDKTGKTTVSWKLHDESPKSVTTIIWVSYDGGTTWLPGAWVHPGAATSVPLDVHDAPEGAEVLARIVASDGFASTTTNEVIVAGDRPRQPGTDPETDPQSDPQTGVVEGAAAFEGSTPVRLLDTRDGNGAPEQKVPAGSSIRVQITGRGGVPADASAVVANVTAVNSEGPGYLTLYGDGRKPLASNLNFDAGQVVPNQAVVPLDDKGGVVVYSHATTDVVLDVAGWFTPVDGPVASGRFVPLTPTRILDTRSDPAGRVEGASSKRIDIVGRAGVPRNNVSAVVLNVTVTEPTGEGYATIWPSGTRRPLASNLNFVAGLTAPNHVTSALSDGGVDLYSSAPAHYVVDVLGYYTDGGSASAAGLFVPLTPSRILDTRFGTGVSAAGEQSSGPLPVQVAGQGGVPSTGVAGVIANATVTGPTGQGYVTVYPDGVSRPLASNLNFVPSTTRANLVSVPVGTSGRIVDFASSSTHLVLDVAGWFTAG